MTRHSIALFLLVTCLGLSACTTPEDTGSDKKAAVAAAALVAPKTTDDAEWKKYLAAVINQHMDVVTDRQTAYYLPMNSGVVPPEASDGKSMYDRQSENITAVISRSVLPGNLLTFGSPDSAKMADLMISAFSGARPDSLRGSYVMFVGKPEDSARVQTLVEASGAKYIFVDTSK